MTENEGRGFNPLDAIRRYFREQATHGMITECRKHADSIYWDYNMQSAIGISEESRSEGPIFGGLLREMMAS